jgi:uncharacterized protein YdeI (YjbR/CyaY-like superfamily)
MYLHPDGSGRVVVKFSITNKDFKFKNKSIVKIVSSDLLEIPEELLVCLEQDEEANKLFSDFTKGLQRSLVHYVSSAKSIDTRIKRSLELLTKIKSRSLSVQKQEKNKDK